jgi:hypothetical protein
MVILQLLIETRMSLGLDPFGVNTPRRMLDILADWDRMAGAEQTAEARAALGVVVDRAAPMLALGAVLSFRRD